MIGIGRAARRTTATTGRCWSSCVRGGEVVGREPATCESARERHARVAARSCPPRAHQLSRGEPVIPTVYEDRPGLSRPRAPTRR